MKQLVPLALTICLAGCAGLRASEAEAPPAAEPAPPSSLRLPPVRADLNVPAEEASLADLVDAFARDNGIQVQRQVETRERLERTPLTLVGPFVVPAVEVYPFLESLLASNGFVMVVNGAGSVPLLTLWSTYRLQRSTLDWLPVEADEIDAFLDHPALLVETSVELSHVDVRQLTTSMRGMLSDTNTQSLLAAGQRHVIVRGRGREVAQMVARFRELDAQAAASDAELEPRPATVEAAGER